MGKLSLQQLHLCAKKIKGVLWGWGWGGAGMVLGELVGNVHQSMATETSIKPRLSDIMSVDNKPPAPSSRDLMKSITRIEGMQAAWNSEENKKKGSLVQTPAIQRLKNGPLFLNRPLACRWSLLRLIHGDPGRGAHVPRVSSNHGAELMAPRGPAELLRRILGSSHCARLTHFWLQEVPWIIMYVFVRL